MVGSIYFTSVANNDQDTLNISGIEEYLQHVLTPYILDLERNHLPYSYADRTYEPSSVITTHNRRRGLLYNHLDSLHKSIEYKLSLASLLTKHLSAKYT